MSFLLNVKLIVKLGHLDGVSLAYVRYSVNLSKLISVYYLNEEGTQGVQDPSINLNNFSI